MVHIRNVWKHGKWNPFSPRYGTLKAKTGHQYLSTSILKTDEASYHYIHSPGQKTESEECLQLNREKEEKSTNQEPPIQEPGLCEGWAGGQEVKV